MDLHILRVLSLHDKNEHFLCSNEFRSQLMAVLASCWGKIHQFSAPHLANRDYLQYMREILSLLVIVIIVTHFRILILIEKFVIVRARLYTSLNH